MLLRRVRDDHERALRGRELLRRARDLQRVDGAGYVVRHAMTVDEAFDICLESTPDLVVLDQFLGDKSGLEVCRRLKTDVALQVIPILVLTASQKEQ